MDAYAGARRFNPELLHYASRVHVPGPCGLTVQGGAKQVEISPVLTGIDNKPTIKKIGRQGKRHSKTHLPLRTEWIILTFQWWYHKYYVSYLPQKHIGQWVTDECYINVFMLWLVTLWIIHTQLNLSPCWLVWVTSPSVDHTE